MYLDYGSSKKPGCLGRQPGYLSSGLRLAVPASAEGLAFLYYLPFIYYSGARKEIGEIADSWEGKALIFAQEYYGAAAQREFRFYKITVIFILKNNISKLDDIRHKIFVFPLANPPSLWQTIFGLYCLSS